MLVANIDVSDGLVKQSIVTSNNIVMKVHVKFDNQQVGLKAVQTSPYRANFPRAIPLGKHMKLYFMHKTNVNLKLLTFSINSSLGNYNTQGARS